MLHALVQSLLGSSVPRRFAGQVLFFALGLGVAGPAAGQQGLAVQPTTYERSTGQHPATAPAASVVRFGQSSSRIGDETEQAVDVESHIKLSIRKGNQVAGNSQSTVHTHQQRIVTVRAVEGGVTTAARIFYPEANREVVSAKQAEDSESGVVEPASDAASRKEETKAVPEQDTPQSVPQPVQGKEYFGHREPGEAGQLVIADVAGQRPPREEYEIVSAHLETLGRPNPLARFLAGRTLAIDEKLEVPNALAKQILNLGDKFGQIVRFTLTLQSVKPLPENPDQDTAVFLADVEAASADASQMRLLLAGPLEVRIDSCRATKLDLAGPIAFTESRGSYSTAHQVIGTGRIRVTIASQYRTTAATR
ncbi:MAG: hypothetical protein IT425_09375 [Pirellulales bacterium]|nr:hypothetical protein [Pirellulales bacterium]